MQRSGRQQSTTSFWVAGCILLSIGLIVAGVAVWRQLQPAERPTAASPAHASDAAAVASALSASPAPKRADLATPALPARAPEMQAPNASAVAAGTPDAAPAEVVRLPADMHGEEAITALGDKLAVVAAAHQMSAEALRHELRKDSDLWVGEAGHLFYACTMLKEPASAKDEPAKVGNSPARVATEQVTVEADTVDTNGNITSTTPLMDTNWTFRLSSRPGASKTIYLDFTGHTTTNTKWNNRTMGASFYSPPFNIEGTPASFSSAEHALIQQAWQQVAEDYAPFDVNVTTMEPPTDWLMKSGSGDTNWGIRVVITSYGPSSSTSGGVAMMNSFNYASDTPCFVYNKSFAGVVEACSHEVGHTLGLSHDGTSTSGYYYGHGSGETSWAPIMGCSYNCNVTTWDNGVYFDSNNGDPKANSWHSPEDMTEIAGYNGFGFRQDTIGNSLTSATPLTVSSGTVGQYGTILTCLDKDVFSFQLTNAGSVNLTVDPYWYRAFVTTSGVWGGSTFTYTAPVTPARANLDVSADLYNAAGVLLASANPAGLAATLSCSGLPAGTYFLQVDGVGFGNPTNNPPTGYTDYGSVGNYWISGTISNAVTPGNQPPTITAQPTNVTVTSGQTALFSVTATGTAPLTYQWYKNNAVIGGATAESYTTPATTTNNSGTQFKVTVTNAYGAVTSSVATLTVNPLPTYTVTYNANGATGAVPSSQIKTQDVTLVLASNSGALAKTGYTFAGWNTAANGSGSSYAAGASYTNNAAVTLYAAWTAVGGGVSATGGTVTNYNENGTSWTAHIFKTVGSTNLNFTVGGNVEVLVVAGGGAGGRGDNGDGAGGGGGAGGLIYTNIAVAVGNYSVFVGTGGITNSTAQSSGSNSVFGSLIALGGGSGGRDVANGGSGGGGFGRGGLTSAGSATQPGSSSGGYGSNGGAGGGGTAGNGGGGGGGGGATSVGIAGVITNGKGGNGGAGFTNSISGVSTVYAGGGGGGSGGSGQAAGTATGGGGAGGAYGQNNGANAVANTGGGGGGGAESLSSGTETWGGNGGSGIVIVRYVANGGQSTNLPTTYEVTYNANGGTGTVPSSQIKTQDVTLVLASNSGALAKTGYTFAGWNTAANGSGSSYAAGASYTNNAAVTLYAAWTALPTYTVTYNANGATGAVPSSQIKTQDVTLVLASNSGSLAKTGYTFAGWNTAANGSGSSYAAGASYTNNAAVTLYAAWTALPTYTVTYNANGATGAVPSSQIKTQDVTLVLASNSGALAKTGYTFAGWNTAADGSGTNYATGASYTANAAVTLYAAWTAVGNGVSATGGTVTNYTQNGINYRAHIFTNVGSTNINVSAGGNVEYLVVGGGGGGGSARYSGAAGGGGGGVLTSNLTFAAGTYTITVGAGGGGGTNSGGYGMNGFNGGDSSITNAGGSVSVIAKGGGGGGGDYRNNGSNGASGGGGAKGDSLGGSPGSNNVPGQGRNGGAGHYSSHDGYSSGGGGGGYGGVGQNATINQGGNGGVGLTNSFTGVAVGYAGGGGGGKRSSTAIGYGNDGGGNGVKGAPTAGRVNSGGGGGGNGTDGPTPVNGAAGGSGIVIVRYVVGSGGATNQAPTANAQSVTTAEDTAKAITLTGSDPEGSNLTYAVVSNPAHGTLSGTAPNVTYTPDANYNGADSFTFQASDGKTNSNVATVSITVTAVNDAPTVTASGSPTSGTSPLAVNFTTTGADVDGDALTYAWTFGDGSTSSPQAAGTASHTYTAVGTYTATVTVSDGKGGSASANVAITVTAAGGGAVGVVNGSFETPSVGSGYVYNPTGATWTISGAIAGANGAWGFTTAPDGTQVCCIQKGSYASQNVNFASNAYRIAFYGAQRAGQQQTVQVSLDGVTLGSFKAVGTTFEAFSTPVVTPGAGIHALKFQGLNLSGDNTMFIDNVILVAVSNQPPVAIAQSVTTAEDTAKAITLTGSDPEGSNLTYTVVSNPAHGTLSGTAPNVTYTPDANYNGSDSFTFKVNDGTLDSTPATVSITVTSVNDEPVAMAGVDPVVGSITDEFYFWATDSYDVDGTITGREWQINGTVVSTNAEFLYTFATGGAYTVTLAVWDNEGASGSDSVEVNVSEPITPVVSVSVLDGVAGEPGLAVGGGRFQVSRIGELTQPLTVNYAMSGTASNGVDYSRLSGTVTLAAGVVSRTVVVDPLPDALVEGTEWAILSLSDGTGYTVDEDLSAGAVMIQDQTYGTPVVTAVAMDASATEPGLTTDKGSIKISRTGSCDAALTVLVVVSGTAVNGVDYFTLTVPVVLAVGQNAKTLTIVPLADGVVESSETVTLTIQANAAYVIGEGQAAATVTIRDNTQVATPTVSVVATDPNAAEPGALVNTGTFTFRRTSRFHETLVMNCTLGGTASNGTDYNTVSAVVTFPAGVATKTLTIIPKADGVTEGSEAVVMTIQASAAYAIEVGKSAATVTIAE
jgi:uncharacterized repeat protein (TIGR02543 family)